MHPLQELFARAEGEQAFEDELRALCEAGDLDGAEAFLAAQVGLMHGEIADLCRALTRESVVLSGWEHLADAIDSHEGEPITGAALAIANELDLAFEKGRMHEPYITAGLFTDEAYAFSSATPEQLIAEGKAAERAAWAGQDEDVELYLEIAGFGPLNTALLFHKQRHFFRDGDPARAPMRYVEYVVGCWWRALRFQQAVAAEYARHGLPGRIPMIAGMIDMRPELVGVHGAGRLAAPAAPVVRRVEAVEMAGISSAELIQRKPVEETSEWSGSALRRRLADSEPTEEEARAERKGLLGRLFTRARPLHGTA